MTFWYALILALALIVFALGSYFLIDQTVRQLADDSLDEASDALITRFESAPDSTNRTIEQTLEDFRFQYIVFAIYDDKNKLIAASPRLKKDSKLKYPTFNISSEKIPNELIEFEFEGPNAYSTFVLENTTNVRIFRESAKIGERSIYVATLRPLTNQAELLANIRFIIFAGIPIALLLSILGGYYLAHRSLSPLIEMNEKASYISSSNLDERLPAIKSGDELDQLASTFNEMLGRLENSFELQKRFMSDASHELRTPLSIMRGEAEVSLQKETRPEEEYRESLEVIEEEGARLSKIVEDLFTLARADADQYKLNLSTFYLDEVIGETAKAVRTLLKARNLKFSLLSDVDMLFEGDEALIRRLVIILLDNSIKYSTEAGTVEVSCGWRNKSYSVRVSNSGPPIPEAEHEKIFERFYRADAARAHKDNYEFGTGAGLGLAMGRWIAEAHNGLLTLERSNKTKTVFEIILPESSIEIK